MAQNCEVRSMKCIILAAGYATRLYPLTENFPKPLLAVGEKTMKWIKMSLKTTVEAEDLVSCTLAELGVEGIEIEDKVPLTEEEKARMFIDILPDLGEDDGEAVVSFYLDPDIDVEAKLSEINEALDELREFTDIGEASIQVSETEDKDWINNWKEFFKPFRVDDRIWIKPTWEKMPDTHSNDLVIEIDPGTAFGTGSHETTRLCILNMKERMKKGDSVLDVGCGSGILSIAASLLGAGDIYAYDIDPVAVKVARDNIAESGLDNITCDVSDLLRQVDTYNAPYGVICANIVADIIIRRLMKD